MGPGMAVRQEARTLPSLPSCSPSVEVSAGTTGLMLAARLVKKSLRKSRASCRGKEQVRFRGLEAVGSPQALPPRSPLT